MAKILPMILQIVAVIGGVFGGLMLKPQPKASPADAHAEEADGDHAKKDKGDKKKAKKDKGHGDKKKKDKHGKEKSKGGHGEKDGSSTGYIKFSRPFIVPVLNSSGRNFVIMMDINIEAPSSATQSAYEKEPKLRDVMLQTLFNLSNEGTFGENLLVENNMDDLREKLLEAAQSVIGEDAQNILILNISKQRV